MSGRPRDPITDDAGTRPEAGSFPAAPGWVKAFGIVAIVLILLVVVGRLTGLGGEHGPGRHLPSGAPGAHLLPANVAGRGA